MAGIEQPRNPPIRRFDARFDSECDHCGGDIFEGDSIAYLPGYDKPACEECTDEYEED